MSETRTQVEVLTRDEVMERINPLMNLNVREVTHGPRTRVIVRPEGVIFRPGGGGHTMEMSEDGVRSMAKYVGIPDNLAGRLNPATFGTVATELLERKDRYSVLTNQGQIVSFHRPGQYRATNPERVLGILESVLGEGTIYSRAMVIRDTAIYVEAAAASETPVIRGDLVQAGTAITFSPIGVINPTVQSFILRCMCTNGWADYDAGGNFSYKYGEGDSVWQFFRRSVRKAYRSIDGILAQWRNMIENQIPPEQRAHILEGLLKEAGITGQVAEALRAMAIETPPENMYDAMNFLTYASTHLLEDPREVQKAQKAASRFVREANPTKVCPLCHSVHN
jgi:hypothetical protein